MKLIFNKTPCIILVGGAGTRFSKHNEEPKQLVKIHKKSLLENIMIGFIKNDIKNFIFPLGHKKSYFLNFFKKKKKILNKKINLVSKIDTNKVLSNQINILLFNSGKHQNKLNRIMMSLMRTNSSHCFVTYGDGLANINFKKYKNTILKNQKCIICSKKIKSQYGHVITNKNNSLIKFEEKPIMDKPINIGYYFFFNNVFKKYFRKHYELEGKFLNKLIRKKEINAFNHNGYFFNIDKKTDLLKLKKEKKNILKLL